MIKVFCEYNSELDVFLKSIIRYIFSTLDHSLNLKALEEIELVDVSTFPYETDGRVINEGKKILLTSRLYSKISTYNIYELENDENFIHIINTLYHELGHVSDMAAMPNIYKAAQKLDNIKQMLPSYFWAEYIAEKRSSTIIPADHSDYCNDFVRRRWRCNKFNFETATEDNFFYLCKAMSYYMGRTTVLDSRHQYNSKMTNPLLQMFVTEIEKELNLLDCRIPFDRVETLSKLYDIMNEYYIKFKKQYALR